MGKVEVVWAVIILHKWQCFFTEVIKPKGAFEIYVCLERQQI